MSACSRAGRQPLNVFGHAIRAPEAKTKRAMMHCYCALTRGRKGGRANREHALPSYHPSLSSFLPWSVRSPHSATVITFQLTAFSFASLKSLTCCTRAPKRATGTNQRTKPGSVVIVSASAHTHTHTHTPRGLNCPHGKTSKKTRTYSYANH